MARSKKPARSSSRSASPAKSRSPSPKKKSLKAKKAPVKKTGKSLEEYMKNYDENKNLYTYKTMSKSDAKLEIQSIEYSTKYNANKKTTSRTYFIKGIIKKSTKKEEVGKTRQTIIGEVFADYLHKEHDIPKTEKTKKEGEKKPKGKSYKKLLVKCVKLIDKYVDEKHIPKDLMAEIQEKPEKKSTKTSTKTSTKKTLKKKSPAKKKSPTKKSSKKEEESDEISEEISDVSSKESE